MKNVRIAKLALIALCAIASLGTQTQESWGGRPSPPPPPPPVKFGMRLFSMPADYVGGSVDVQQINDLGEAVGRYSLPDDTRQPFYFNASSVSTVATNLNDLPLDPDWAVPNGWYIQSALGINNLGDIVGKLAMISDPSRGRGFILELRPDPLGQTLLPRLHLIPDDTWNATYARRINDMGDVLGACDSTTAYIYRAPLHGAPGDVNVEILPFGMWVWDALMNNPTPSHGTQIVAWSDSLNAPFRYTMETGNTEVLNLPISGIRGLSDSGSFCGHQYIKRKDNPFYYDGSIHALTGASFGQDINSDNDVLGEGNTGTNKPVLFHSEVGTLDLSKLVVASNSSEQQIWSNGYANWSKLTERNIPGTDPAVASFPAITGSIRTTTNYYWAYVLRPIPVQ